MGSRFVAAMSDTGDRFETNPDARITGALESTPNPLAAGCRDPTPKRLIAQLTSRTSSASRALKIAVLPPQERGLSVGLRRSDAFES